MRALLCAPCVFLIVMLSIAHVSADPESNNVYDELIAQAKQLRTNGNNKGALDKLLAQYKAADVIAGVPKAKLAAEIGFTYRAMGMFTEAMDHFLASLESAETAPGYTGVGIGFSEAGNDSNAMIALYKAVETDKMYIEAHVQLGHAFARQKHSKEAILAYETALKLDKRHNDALSGIAHVHLTNGDEDEAIAAFERVTMAHPTDDKAWLTWANILINQSKYEESASVLVAGTALNPQSSRLHTQLAQLYMAIGRPRHAISSLKSALKLIRDNFTSTDEVSGIQMQREVPGGKRAEPDGALHFMLGMAFLEVDAFTKALESLTAALTEFPAHHEAAFYLGRTLMDIGFFDEACNMYERAARLLEDDMYKAGYSECKALKDFVKEKTHEEVHSSALGLMGVGNAARGKALLMWLVRQPTQTENTQAMNDLAFALSRTGLHALAESQYNEVLKVKRLDARAVVGLAQMAWETGHYEAALKRLDNWWNYAQAPDIDDNNERVPVMFHIGLLRLHYYLHEASRPSEDMSTTAQALIEGADATEIVRRAHEISLLVQKKLPEFAPAQLLQSISEYYLGCDHKPLSGDQALRHGACGDASEPMMAMDALTKIMGEENANISYGALTLSGADPLLSLMPVSQLVKAKKLNGERVDIDARLINSVPLSSGLAMEHKGRLRIGYVSSRFENDAPAIISLAASHNASMVEVFAYAIDPVRGALNATYKPDDDTLKHFVNLGAATIKERANFIMGDRIQVLVALDPENEPTRRLLAMRVAPLQAVMSASPTIVVEPFVDFVLASKGAYPAGASEIMSCEIRTVTPPHVPFGHIYKYRNIYLDDGSPVRSVVKRGETLADRIIKTTGVPTRTDETVVLATFERIQEVEPAVRQGWLDVLKAVGPRAVLWLGAAGQRDACVESFKEQAVAKGLDASQIIAKPIAKESVDSEAQDLAMVLGAHSLVDLILSSGTPRAVGLAADALWAGVPVVHFEASRGTPYSIGARAARMVAIIARAGGIPAINTHEEAVSMGAELAKAARRAKLAKCETCHRTEPPAGVARSALSVTADDVVRVLDNHAAGTHGIFNPAPLARAVETEALATWEVYYNGAMMQRMKRMEAAAAARAKAQAEAKEKADERSPVEKALDELLN